MEKVNLVQAFQQIQEHWSPRIAGAVNDTHIKLAKLQGEFIWHRHDNEDELFLMVQGRLLMQFRDGDMWLEPGEFVVVPRGVEHCPVAPEEVHLLLVEPATTLNTGNVQNERTVAAQRYSRVSRVSSENWCTGANAGTSSEQGEQLCWRSS
jgi:mannose-6-phosphate isomerase-like protein (cupin superfamily)